MTSAHRSTFHSAKGKSEPGGHRTMQSNLISAKDMPNYLKIKTRNEIEDDLKIRNLPKNPLIKSKEDYKRELLEKEKNMQAKSKNILQISYEKTKKDEEQDMDTLSERSKKINKENTKIIGIDKDEQTNENKEYSEEDDDNESIEEDDEDEDEDEEDEETAILREFEKIKKEREEEKRIHDEKEAEKVKNRSEIDILSGNPLYAEEYSLKKKWYEDTVFKNQAKKETKPEKYNNDTLHTEYHKSFMSKTFH